MIYDIELKGCAPVPLAYYLKALGVLRLVTEQVDSDARGFWHSDTFVLRSKLDSESLVRFFLREYRPTPIVAPWNGGSGFSPDDNQEAIIAIQNGKTNRLKEYKEVISKAFAIRRELGIEKKVEKDKKDELLIACRAHLPDAVVHWLDAAFVIVEDGVKYPPLLGTGGNDGRLDFTNNFMQRLCDVFDVNTGEPKPDAETWLNGALFAFPLNGLLKGAAIGQFFPSAVGGVNAETGFDAGSLVNPWDYILMLEGSLFFATASVKRLGTRVPGVLSYPFSVNMSGVGYGSAAMVDEFTSRAEIWVPIWDSPVTTAELRMLFAEGRAQVGRRHARNGVDFARAVATLGVDRGISVFYRYGFQARNGRAYFAIPLSRFYVIRQPQVNLLSDVDNWLTSFTSKAASDNAPASVVRSLRQLEEAILALCREQGPVQVQDVLIALGKCEKALVKSNKWANDSFINPIPPLSKNWLKEADDGSPELRLAASLASVYGQYCDKKGQKFWMPVRTQLEPVLTKMKDGHLEVGWNEEGVVDIAWSDGDPIRALNNVMSQRIMRAVQSGADTYPDKGRLYAEISDIADFIEGRIDTLRMTDLLWGLILLDWPSITKNVLTMRGRSDAVFPGAGYGLMKLCFPGGEVKGLKIPLVPEIHRRAALGDGAGATQLAIRRLRGCGLAVASNTVDIHRERAQRIAAALLFPVGDYQLTQITDKVLKLEIENTKGGI